MRFWKRTDTQLFLEEERQKQLEEGMEKDALRDDFTAAKTSGGDVGAVL